MADKSSIVVKWLCFMVILGLLAVSSASALDAKRVLALKDKGEQELDRGDIEKAMQTFRQMEAACGQDGFCLAVASLFMGRCLLEIDRYPEALDLFRKSEEAFAGFGKPAERGVASLMIGRALTRLGELDQALSYFETAEQGFRRISKGQDKNLFYCHLWKVDAYLGMFRFEEAKDSLRKAEAVYGIPTRKGFPQMGHPEVLANRYKADILAKTQDLKAAEALYRNLLTYYERSPNPRAHAWIFNEVGYLHALQSEYDDALRFYGEGLALAKRSGALLAQDHILNNIGLVLMDQGDYDAALASFEKSMKLRKQSGNPRLEAQGLNNAALVHFFLGDYEKALEQFRQASTLSKGKNWLDVEGNILHNLALLYKDQGLFQQARDNSLAAIEVANKAKNDKDSAIFTLRLGNLYEYYGQFEHALDAYESAKELQEKVRDRFFLSNTLADIANAKIRLIPPEETPEQAEKRLLDAEDNYRKAISIRKEIGSPTAEILCKAALVHMEKPQFVSEPLSAGQRTSDLRAAAEYIGQAEQELTSRPRPNRNHKFLVDYARARHLFLEGKHKEALDRFKALNGEARAARLLKYEFLARVGMGLCYEQLKELPQAEEAFEQAQTIAEDIRDSLDPEGKRTFLSGEEVLGIKHVQAYEGLARVRQQMGHAATNTELWRSALRASEGTKARAFADSLAKSQWSRTTKVDQQLVRKLDDIEDQLRTKNLQLAKSVAGKGNPNRIKGLEAARAGLKSQRDAVAKAIKAQDRDYYTVRFASTIDLPESQIMDTEWALVYEVTDTAVLGWLTHGSKMVDAAYVPLARQTLEAQVDLVRKGFVRDVWSKIQSREVTRVSEISHKEWDYQALLAAKKIYDSLVRSFVEQIPEKETLIIVTDDCLALIPFEMLVTNGSESPIPRGRGPKPGEIRFLGDRNPILYYQSVTALTLARLKWKTAASPAGKLLVMADPRVECRSEEDVKADRREEMRRQLQVLGGSGRSTFKAGKKKALAAMSGEIQFLSRDSCSDQKLSPELPETADLAKAVGTMFEGKNLDSYAGEKDSRSKGLRRFKGKNVEVYSGKDASLKEFRLQIQPQIAQYGRLLFATHGVFKDEGESGGPALMLSTDPPGSYNWLTSAQITELPMNVDVAALIACSTGLGHRIAGEGVMGMGRSFHQAGSRTVLMSLWNTEATASTRMAETFFAKVLQGQSKLQAFQEARQELRKVNGGEYAHPVFWAPFIMVGEAGSAGR
ncbi:MAG: CHAT domain-containing tetratricopeptide repeat protein [Thermodesulfobacteriota bacterium]